MLYLLTRHADTTGCNVGILNLRRCIFSFFLLRLGLIANMALCSPRTGQPRTGITQCITQEVLPQEEHRLCAEAWCLLPLARMEVRSPWRLHFSDESQTFDMLLTRSSTSRWQHAHPAELLRRLRAEAEPQPHDQHAEVGRDGWPHGLEPVGSHHRLPRHEPARSNRQCPGSVRPLRAAQAVREEVHRSVARVAGPGAPCGSPDLQQGA